MQPQVGVVGLALADPRVDGSDSKRWDEERDWSLLPGNIIWGIRDRLNSLEEMRVSEVCRSWQSAIKPGSEQQLPWAFCYEDQEFRDHSVINVSTKQVCKLKMPDSTRSEYLLCSKQGWLFLQHVEPDRRAKSFCTCLFNPITGVTIELPDIDVHTVGAAISTASSGAPQLVVVVSYCCWMGKYPITLHTIHPGDKGWEVHTYGNYGCPQFDVSVILRGSREVYCFDPFGRRVYVFDLSDKSWRTCPTEHGGRYLYLVESDGDIINVDRSGSGSFVFSRMQVEAGGSLSLRWVEMSKSELEDRLWFLIPNGSLSVRGRGRKVYEMKNRTDICVRDLAEGTTESLFPDPLPCPVYGWVDIVGSVSSSFLE